VPELPDVAVYVEALEKRVLGATLERVGLRSPFLLRSVDPPIRAIEGKWRGQIKFAGGPYEIFYLTVNSNGSIVASWGATTRWGKVTLSGGKVTYNLTRARAACPP